MQVAQINPAQMGGNPLTAFQEGRQALAQGPINLRAGQGIAPGQVQQYMMSNALRPQRDIQMAGKAPVMIDYHKDQRERDAYRRDLEKKFVDQQILQENNALAANNLMDMERFKHDLNMESEMKKHGNMLERDSLLHENTLERDGLGHKSKERLEGLRYENNLKIAEFENDLKTKFRQEGRDYEEDRRRVLEGYYGSHLSAMVKEFDNWKTTGREDFRRQQKNAFVSEMMADPNAREAFKAKYGKNFQTVDRSGQTVVNEMHPNFAKALRKYLETEGFDQGAFEAFVVPLELREQERISMRYHMALSTAIKHEIAIDPLTPGSDTVRAKEGVPTLADGLANGTVDPMLFGPEAQAQVNGQVKPPEEEGDNPFIAQDIYGAAKNIGNALTPDNMDAGDVAGLGTGALIAEQTTKADKDLVPKMNELRPKGKAERAKSPYGGPTSKAKDAYEKRKLQVVRDAAKDLKLNLGNLSDQDIKDMDPMELRRKLVASRQGIITRYLNKGTLSTALKNKYVKMLGKGAGYLGAVAIGHDLITAMTDEDARAIIAGNKVAEVINEGIDAGGSAGVTKGDDGVIRFN